MNIDYTVGEVELSYKPKFKNIYKVVSSEDAYKYLLPTYKEGTICYKEYFKVLFLNMRRSSCSLWSRIARMRIARSSRRA